MEDLPPVLEPAPKPVLPPPGSSLLARLLNVFAVPGEVFEELTASRFQLGNWLVPVLLLAVVGAVSAIVIFSQPSVQQNLREQQSKLLAQQVQAGKMKQADMDKALELSSNPVLLKCFGSVGAVVLSVVRVLWWGLVLWLLGRWFLKASFDFPKALEVAGLALMISVLGAIVSLLLTVNLGRVFTTPSLALAVQDFEASRKSHLFLGAANFFAVWQIGVTGLGLAKLARVPFLRAATLVFVFWVLQTTLFISVGMGDFALQ